MGSGFPKAELYKIIDLRQCKTVALKPTLTITLKSNHKHNHNVINLTLNPILTMTLKSNP